MAIITGKVWRFGDGIDTDVLAPGAYMKLPIEVSAKHTLEAIDPSFAPGVRPGDIVVGGLNFGLGSSREQAAIHLKQLGVGCVLATSFARIFYRNALNVGLPVLFFPGTAEVTAGQVLTVDPVAGTVTRADPPGRWAVDPIPAHLMEMVDAGGLLDHLKLRLAAQRAAG